MLNLQIGDGASTNEVSREALRQAVDYLKTLDKDVQKTVKKYIKDSIGGVTKQMTDWINAQDPMPPLSGMGRVKTGGWSWSNAVVKPSLRLSAGPGKPLAQITAQGKTTGKQRLFAIVERAGTRSGGFTPAGKRMIGVLDERAPKAGSSGGRYAFKAFLIYRPDLVDRVQLGLNTLADLYNQKADRG